MLESIRRFFQKEVAEPPAESPDALRIAACALLLEVAYADGEFTPDERGRIEDALGRHFGLDEALARELIALADQERTRSIDHFQFTRLIRDRYDLGQKVLLAELMWGVILADGKIADHEGYLVRKIGSLLELPAAYLSEAKQRVRGEESGA